MISQVDICNLALTHLGIKAISSVDEASEPARKIKLIYPTTVDSVLRDHSWNFASKTEALALLSSETLLNWDFLYIYPSNAVKIRLLLTTGTDPEAAPVEFKECLSPQTNQKAIATDLEQAYAEYTSRITDPNLFDAIFIDALSYRLASMLGQPLCGDANLGKSLGGTYAALIGQAKTANKGEGTEKAARVSNYVNAR